MENDERSNKLVQCMGICREKDDSASLLGLLITWMTLMAKLTS